ncbi:hypothetical protein QRD38_17105 [Leptospira weilii]|uniref:Uncharacterized protein n=3 Tax=Leptospira weilii TaxID=28184 RepID=M6FL19_9LEPT|nr:hypothetical protein [Leptospira weilii]EMM73105.1 hypothetical protein LEP1GSC038_0223 [Leptospira weilii str. 2006001855]MDL5247461.1 hypothetical protein [Leptospira weilii]
MRKKTADLSLKFPTFSSLLIYQKLTEIRKLKKSWTIHRIKVEIKEGKEMVKTLTLELPVATGEALEKLNLAGIWKDREIGDSTVKKEVSELSD